MYNIKPIKGGTSLAAGVGASVKNVQFQSEALNLPRKITILATYDPAKTTVVVNSPIQVLSAEDAGDRFGFGFMAHRLALQAFLGGQGVPVFIHPQAEAGGAAAATGDIDFTGSTGVLAGTVHLSIANIPVQIAIPAAATAANIATAVVAAVTADKTLPVTAAVDGGTAGQVNFTSKSKGPWGNDISIKLNRGYGQVLPTGVVAAITAMSGGAGIPSVSVALDALGSGSGVAACDATNHADAAYHNAEIGQPLTSTASSNLIDVILHFNFTAPAGFSIWAAIRRRKELAEYWEEVLKGDKP